MSISKDRRELYPSMSVGERMAIHKAYSEVVTVLNRAKIKTKGDDCAENLVGAIARYVEESRA